MGFIVIIIIIIVVSLFLSGASNLISDSQNQFIIYGIGALLGLLGIGLVMYITDYGKTHTTTKIIASKKVYLTKFADGSIYKKTAKPEDEMTSKITYKYNLKQNGITTSHFIDSKHVKYRSNVTKPYLQRYKVKYSPTFPKWAGINTWNLDTKTKNSYTLYLPKD